MKPAAARKGQFALDDLLGRYCDLLLRADTWFQKCRAAAGDRLRCTAGCRECCQGLFDITLLDALQLQDGVAALPDSDRESVLALARAQIARLQKKWPDFRQPFLLNDRPVSEWEVPEEDGTPCPLLGRSGECLVYASRPLICRLHGLAHIDVSGEVFLAEGCTLHGPCDPREQPELRWEFRNAFAEEARLLRQLASCLGKDTGELDTFISAALLIDFDTLSD